MDARLRGHDERDGLRNVIPARAGIQSLLEASTMCSSADHVDSSRVCAQHPLALNLSTQDWHSRVLFLIIEKGATWPSFDHQMVPFSIDKNISTRVWRAGEVREPRDWPRIRRLIERGGRQLLSRACASAPGEHGGGECPR